MKNTFITKEKAKSNKKQLLYALSINTKAVNLLLKKTTTPDDLKNARHFSSKCDFKTKEKEIAEMMFDISIALSKTYCNDDASTKSTALTNQFKDNWTIGSLGSIFVDLIVNGKALRVSFFTFNMAKQLGYDKAFFWIESLAL